MGLFGNLKEKLTGGASRISGKTDLLEGICAACALVAAADGDISDDEVASALDALKDHDTIGAAFKEHEIESAADKQLGRAKKGNAGRLGLRRELQEAKAKNAFEDMEMLMMIAIDVAAASGAVEPAERKVLIEIGKIVGVPAESYLPAA